MKEKILNISMKERIQKYGTAILHIKDNPNIQLMSNTNIPINTCCGCVHEDDCLYINFFGSNHMPCEV
jgi:hypothetical protein